MNALVRITYIFGAIFIVLGIVAYLVAEPRSLTALIPAGIGVLMLATGYGTTIPSIGRYMGMATALLVVVLILGSFRGVGNLLGALVGGGDITIGMIAQTVIVVLGVVYLGLVGQHMSARRKHAA